MGFLKKIFKGVKKVFKNVGKTIKKVVSKVGKFMDRIGIVGQIGLSLLLPGIGAAMSGMWGSLVGGLQAYTGVGSTIINGAGNFLNAATQIAGTVGKSFSTISQGVQNVVGETLKFGANKLGLGQVATSLGERYGSEYLMNLGNSISEASLSSIGDTFNSSVGAVMDSFSGDAFGTDSIYETSRREAAGIPKLTEAAEFQPQIDYSPDLTTPDTVPEAMATPPVTEPSDVTTVPVPATGGTVSRPVSKSLLGRTAEEATKFIQELPETAVGAVKQGVTSSLVSGVRQAAGVEQVPTYTQTSYATVVPTISEAPMVGAPSAIDPIQYVAQNQTSINSQPFGYNANMYNEATYLNLMRKYGFA